MPIATKTLVVPDLNKNMEIEAAAVKAGAYAGAAITAVIGGLATGAWSLFCGAKMGATVTHGNLGNVEVETTNNSIGAKQQLKFINGKLHSIDPTTGSATLVQPGTAVNPA